MAFNVYSKKRLDFNFKTHWRQYIKVLRLPFLCQLQTVQVQKPLQSKWIRETWLRSSKRESLAQYVTILFCANTFLTSQWCQSRLSVLSFALIPIAKGAKKKKKTTPKLPRCKTKNATARLAPLLGSLSRMLHGYGSQTALHSPLLSICLIHSSSSC